MNSTLDLPALTVAVLVAAVITAALMIAHRGERNRRGWITAGVLVLVLVVIGFLDLMRESPREMRPETVVFGAAIPVLSALGLIRATRRVSPWIRWALVFATSLVTLFVGLLVGAAIFYRLVPTP